VGVHSAGGGAIGSAEEGVEQRTVVGVGVDGPPCVDVVAGPDLRPLHPVGQQPHPRPRLLVPTCRRRLYCSSPTMGTESESRTAGGLGGGRINGELRSGSAASEGRGRGVCLPRLNGVAQGEMAQ
jgi:hypothetical protein